MTFVDSPADRLLDEDFDNAVLGLFEDTEATAATSTARRPEPAELAAEDDGEAEDEEGTLSIRLSR